MEDSIKIKINIVNLGIQCDLYSGEIKLPVSCSSHHETSAMQKESVAKLATPTVTVLVNKGTIDDYVKDGGPGEV